MARGIGGKRLTMQANYTADNSIGFMPPELYVFNWPALNEVWNLAVFNPDNVTAKENVVAIFKIRYYV